MSEKNVVGKSIIEKGVWPQCGFTAVASVDFRRNFSSDPFDGYFSYFRWWLTVFAMPFANCFTVARGFIVKEDY